MKIREELIQKYKSDMVSMVERLREADIKKNLSMSAWLFRQYHDSVKDIPFRELSSIPKGKPIELPSVKSGVILTTNITKEDGEILYFKTLWTGGASLVNHFHSDANETLECIKGSFDCIVENHKSGEVQRFQIKETDRITITAGWRHQVTALCPRSELDITFNKIEDETSFEHCAFSNWD